MDVFIQLILKQKVFLYLHILVNSYFYYDVDVCARPIYIQWIR